MYGRLENVARESETKYAIYARQKEQEKVKRSLQRSLLVGVDFSVEDPNSTYEVAFFRVTRYLACLSSTSRRRFCDTPTPIVRGGVG